VKAFVTGWDQGISFRRARGQLPGARDLGGRRRSAASVTRMPGPGGLEGHRFPFKAPERGVAGGGAYFENRRAAQVELT